MEVVEGRATVDDVDAFLAQLSAVGEETGCTVQAFDARYVMGRQHLRRAVELADRAFERGENVARERAVEVLLYAAGRRQIDRALTMGVGEGEQDVVVVVDGEQEGTDDERAAAERVADLLAPADTLDVEHADPDPVRAFFDVSPAEEAAAAGDLRDLVLERVALLDVEK
jgi:KEOPS complex subunit Cgi121